MRAGTEVQGRHGMPRDIEAIRAIEDLGIAVGRSDEEHDAVTLGDHPAVQLDIDRRHAPREMAVLCAATPDCPRPAMLLRQDGVRWLLTLGGWPEAEVRAKAIVAMTDSGSTALWMSRHRIHIPIYALTPKVATQRRMALFRNVRPLLMDTSADRDTALDQAESQLKLRNIVSSGDVYAITCGEPMGAPGGTNMLKICRAI